MADAADRTTERMERETTWRNAPAAPRQCIKCGGDNDRQCDGYAVCLECLEALTGAQ